MQSTISSLWCLKRQMLVVFLYTYTAVSVWLEKSRRNRMWSAVSVELLYYAVMVACDTSPPGQCKYEDKVYEDGQIVEYYGGCSKK